MSSLQKTSTLKMSSRFEGLSQRLLRQTKTGIWFNVICGVLAWICSLCAFPVVPIIVSACLISPRKWHSISLSVSLGCAMGATILVMLFHFFGWALIDSYFPEFLNHPAWQSIVKWISNYGTLGLLAIAASPFPEMPALIVLGVSKPNTIMIFLAILTGKFIKYGVIALVVSNFPDRVNGGINGLFRSIGRNKFNLSKYDKPPKC